MSVHTVFTCDRCGTEKRFDSPRDFQPSDWFELWPAAVSPYGIRPKPIAFPSELVCVSCLTDEERSELRQQPDDSDIPFRGQVALSVTPLAVLHPAGPSSSGRCAAISSWFPFAAVASVSGYTVDALRACGVQELTRTPRPRARDGVSAANGMALEAGKPLLRRIE
jgi:hypothetical protein